MLWFPSLPALSIIVFICHWEDDSTWAKNLGLFRVTLHWLLWDELLIYFCPIDGDNHILSSLWYCFLLWYKIFCPWTPDIIGRAWFRIQRDLALPLNLALLTWANCFILLSLSLQYYKVIQWGQRGWLWL